MTIFLFMLISCGTPGDKGSQADESEQDIIKKEVILSPETQDLLNRFPTPLEGALMLREAKAPYVFSLTNSPANLNRYFTEKTKAINLGIYSTDLAYSSAYQRASETEKFLYCTSKLAGDLGISGVYDRSLIDKLNSKSTNRDSLVALIQRFFSETGNFLRRNNRNQVAVLVAAGGFVEGLYIASSLCQVVTDNGKIASVIYSQKVSLDKIIRILGEYGDDSNVRPVADELAKLKPVYTEYLTGSGKAVPARTCSSIAELAGAVRASMIK